MTKDCIPKEELAQNLWLWYLEYAGRKDEIANEIGFKISRFRPQKRIKFMNEFGMLLMFMVHRAVFCRFEKNTELIDQIMPLFFKIVFAKLPPDSTDCIRQQLQERSHQYDQALGSEGRTMLASTFIGNVFDDPMLGMTFEAIPLQMKLLAYLSGLNKALEAFDIIDND